jgi:hypothetical protein
MIDKILGNSTEISHEIAEKELGGILTQGEIIENSYRLIRDIIVFTNKRLILLDKMGITGTKINITTIPYKSIISFSVTTAGTLDLDSELNIHIKDNGASVFKKFQAGELIYRIQAALVQYTCI